MHLVYWLNKGETEIEYSLLLSKMKETPQTVKGFVENGCWEFLWKDGKMFVGSACPKNYIVDKPAKPLIFKVTDTRGDYNRIMDKAHEKIEGSL